MSNSLLAQIKELFNQQKYGEVSSLVKSNLAQLEDISQKKELLILSAQSNYNLSNNKQALEDILQCKKLMTEVSSPTEELIHVEIQRAKILRRLGDKGKSLQIYDRILKDYQDSLDENTKATIFHNLANLYLEKGTFEQSKSLFEEAIKIDNKNKNENGLAQGYSGLGGLFFYLGEYDQAIDYYKRSLKIRSKNKDLLGQATILFNLGSTYANMLSEKNALSYLSKAERIFRKIGHQKGEQTVLNTKAQMFFNLKNYVSVIKSLNYLQMIPENKITSQNLSMIVLLIESLLHNGNSKQANTMIDKTLEATKAFDGDKKKHHISEIAKLMHLKSQYWFKNKNYENSLQVLDELENLATLFQDDESLIAIHFSKSQILYVTKRLEEAKVLAQKGLKLSLKLKNPTSIAFLDLLFGIDWNYSNFSGCIASARELGQYVHISRKSVLDIIIRTLQYTENDRVTKTSSKDYNLLSEEVLIPTFYLELISLLATGKLTLSKLDKLYSTFKNHNILVDVHLNPYFLLMLNLVQAKQEEREKYFPLLQNGNKLYSLFSRVVRKQVLIEDILEKLEKKKTQKTINFRDSMLILDIVYYSILFGFISKKYLVEIDWSISTKKEQKEIIILKQNLLIKSLRDKEKSEFEDNISIKNAELLYTNIVQNLLNKTRYTEAETKLLLQGIIADLVTRTISLINSGELSGPKTKKVN